jgi:hypothetical protein
MVVSELLGNAELARISDGMKAWFCSCSTYPACIDVAFVGNSSGHYPSAFGLMVDFDAFVFVERMDRTAGDPLAALRDCLADECDAHGIDFELRIIEGPYKPPIVRLRRPIFVVHLGVFTEALYLASPPLKRWAWRKYRCEREPGRLARMAPSQPTLAEFIVGRKGLRQRRAAIENGSVEMTEWLLPSLTAMPLIITPDQTNFVECCFAYAANTARNHARALGLAQADQLNNAEFFPWYNDTLLRSPELLHLMAYKAHSRDTGFELPVERARELAVGYMRTLEQQLVCALTPVPRVVKEGPRFHF